MPYVDLHCHILPGLDDGARSLADAVHFARLLDREDVLDVATTSHIKRAHFPGIDIFELDGRREELQQAASAAIIVLLVMVLGLNALAIFIRNKFQRSW